MQKLLFQTSYKVNHTWAFFNQKTFLPIVVLLKLPYVIKHLRSCISFSGRLKQSSTAGTHKFQTHQKSVFPDQSRRLSPGGIPPPSSFRCLPSLLAFLGLYSCIGVYFLPPSFPFLCAYTFVQISAAFSCFVIAVVTGFICLLFLFFFFFCLVLGFEPRPDFYLLQGHQF